MIWMKEVFEGQWHMAPQNDDVMHEIREDCLCGPTPIEDDITGDVILMHKALRKDG